NMEKLYIFLFLSPSCPQDFGERPLTVPCLHGVGGNLLLPLSVHCLQPGPPPQEGEGSQGVASSSVLGVQDRLQLDKEAPLDHSLSHLLPFQPTVSNQGPFSERGMSPQRCRSSR
uniref:Uncharacterized protein n=1 Tax=Naja naja TaxID=35670 RepID=A0A8C6XVQ6_NAJNA